MSDPRKYSLYAKDNTERGGMALAMVLLAICSLLGLIGIVSVRANASDCINNGGEWISGHCYVPDHQKVGQ